MKTEYYWQCIRGKWVCRQRTVSIPETRTQTVMKTVPESRTESFSVQEVRIITVLLNVTQVGSNSDLQNLLRGDFLPKDALLAQFYEQVLAQLSMGMQVPVK